MQIQHIRVVLVVAHEGAEIVTADHDGHQLWEQGCRLVGGGP